MGLQFDVYMDERVTEEQRNLVNALQETYMTEKGWNLFRVADIARQSIRGPLVGIMLNDKNGNLVWSARRRGVLAMSRHGEKFDAPMDMVRKALPIIVSGEEVGKLEFYSFPLPEGIEAQFLSRFDYYMSVAIFGMLLLAGVLSFIVANGLSRPILGAANRAKEISRGGYHNNIDALPKSKIIEIETLSESLESLARSLEGQETLRKRLMGDIAHELRTPLTVIKAQLEAMADGVIEPEQQNLFDCVAEADRLTRLISNVENLAQLEADSLVIKREKCDISTLLSELVRSFSILYNEAGIVLEEHITGGIRSEIDIDKMKQVFENLLSNALRYTDSGGRVEVIAERKKDGFIVKIRDTGIGVDEKDLPHIFERFYRADVSRTRATGGRGLGLAIAKAIVESHGGTITAENNHDIGSTFTVSI